MRGFNSLKREAGLAWLRDLKNGLVGVVFKEVGNEASQIFFGASTPVAECVIRQFLLERYGGPPLNRAILHAIGSREPVNTALPGSWKLYLRSQGLQVASLRSSLAWQLVVLQRFAHGTLYAIRLVVKTLKSAFAGQRQSLPRHVYFESLSTDSLPATPQSESSFDICSFYAQWQGHSDSFTEICHGVTDSADTNAKGIPVRYLAPPYESASSFYTVVRLCLWILWATGFAGLELLRGRWFYALLLAEATKAKVVQLHPADRLAAEYLFHFSGSIYRPMWTYEAERHGAGVAAYFYSTYEQPKLQSGYESQSFEWGPANWPKYIVWDTFQEAMLRRDLGQDIQIFVAGPIYFSDSGKPVPAVPANSVAVFDMQPLRSSAHFGISTVAEYWVAFPDVHLRFLNDVVESLRNCGFAMVLKGKRHIGDRGEKRQKALVEKLSALEGVHIADPSISAIRVLAECRASISVPFTSTAIYSQQQGLPTAYYDPVGWIQKDDRGAHGIRILSGKVELDEWLAAVLRFER